MKKVASLRYGVIFKKAFCDVDVFKGFVRDILGINIEIDKVETEKEFKPYFFVLADNPEKAIKELQTKEFGETKAHILKIEKTKKENYLRSGAFF